MDLVFYLILFSVCDICRTVRRLRVLLVFYLILFSVCDILSCRQELDRSSILFNSILSLVYLLCRQEPDGSSILFNSIVSLVYCRAVRSWIDLVFYLILFSVCVYLLCRQELEDLVFYLILFSVWYIVVPSGAGRI